MRWHKVFKWLSVITVISLLAFLASNVNVVETPQGNKTLVIGTVAEAAGTADYVCDGVADNVQFQAALDALPAGGGELVVLSGNYVFAATVTRAIANVTITGVGRASYFAFDGVTDLFTAGGNNWVFSNIRTDAGDIGMGATTGWSWENVTINADYYAYRTPRTSTTGADWEIPTGRSATYVVAASDAPAHVKAQADYVCDGTADNVEIQAAIDALVAGNGGKINFSEGGFNIATTVNLAGLKGAVLEGAGKFYTDSPTDGTWFRIMNDPGTAFSLTATTGGVTFRDFSVWSATQTATIGFALASASNLVFHNIYTPMLSQGWDLSGYCYEISWDKCRGGQGERYYGIKIVSGQDYKITDSFFPCSDATTGASIYASGVKWLNIQGCDLRDSSYGVFISGSNHVLIQNNIIGGNDLAGIAIVNSADSYDIQIIGNEFDDNGITAATYERAHITNVAAAGTFRTSKLTIIGNHFTKGATTPYYGVYLDYVYDLTMTGNNLRTGFNDVAYVGTHLTGNAIVKDNIGLSPIINPLRPTIANILGLGDVRGLWAFDAESGTSVLDYSKNAHTFTISPTLANWATQPYIKGSLPIYTFDRASNYLTQADSADFSFGNGANDSAFSVVALIKPTAAGTSVRTIISKWNEGGGTEDREWQFRLADNNTLQLWIMDNSEVHDVYTATNSAISAATHLVTATYDGSGGATAASGIKIYVDGLLVAVTATNHPDYVAMENGASPLRIGALANTANYYGGEMSMPFVIAKELTANEVWQLYQLYQGLLGN